VRVRFYLGIGPHALPAREARKYFQDGWRHFMAEGNGLDDIPHAKESCSFLVLEDFGTNRINLEDVNQWRHVPREEESPSTISSTEGRSGKTANDRGRWGIGKYVFPRSSRLSAFVAVTVRADDEKRLLMGQAVLKSHTVGKKYFTPDGDYGRSNRDGLTLPVGDKTFLSHSPKTFGLSGHMSRLIGGCTVDWTRISHLKLFWVQSSRTTSFPILTGRVGCHRRDR